MDVLQCGFGLLLPGDGFDQLSARRLEAPNQRRDLLVELCEALLTKPLTFASGNQRLLGLASLSLGLLTLRFQLAATSQRRFAAGFHPRQLGRDRRHAFTRFASLGGDASNRLPYLAESPFQLLTFDS